MYPHKKPFQYKQWYVEARRRRLSHSRNGYEAAGQREKQNVDVPHRRVVSQRFLARSQGEREDRSKLITSRT